MSKTLALVATVGALAFVACDSFGQAMTAHTDVVARVGSHELTTQEASSFLSLNPQIPASTDVADAIANLWVDYMVLAMAAADDSSLQRIDLEPLIRTGLQQEMVWKLRDKVIQVDTSFTEAELRAQYEREQPNLRVRARHILFRLPPDATPAQRDSLLTLARRVREQAAGGADFAALARQHSQDVTAQQGGDLGLFGRGQMVEPFEEAAFSLAPGQVSEIVETPFGLHIIKVEERELPPFEQQKDDYRLRARQQAQYDAEEGYVKQLTDPKKVAVEEDAFDVARDLARQPTRELGNRAGNRPLVTYEGGALTAREFQELMRRFSPAQRASYGSANDEQLQRVLDGLAKNEILIAEAERQGFRPEPAYRDSLLAEARAQLSGALSASGLKNIEPQEGETKEQAIERRVNALIEQIVRGEQNVLPVAQLTFFLRDEYNARIFDRALPEVVALVEASRRQAPQAPPGMPQPSPVPTPPDTGGGR